MRRRRRGAGSGGQGWQVAAEYPPEAVPAGERWTGSEALRELEEALKDARHVEQPGYTGR